MLLNEPFNWVQAFIIANPTIKPEVPKSLTLPKMKGVYVESKHYTNVHVAENEVLGIKSKLGEYECHLTTLRDYWEVE